jgi:hypothetical protein
MKAPMKIGKLASTCLLSLFVCSSAFATESDDRVAIKPAGPWDSSTVDLAKLSADAKVVYVSSGSLSLARRIIDGNPATSFDFSSFDPHPTAVVELAENRRLHRVTALCKMEGGRLDVYLLDKFDNGSTDFLNAKPIASITNPNGGKTAVEFEPRGARYVALRWTREKATTTSFKVAEISAFAADSYSAFDFVPPPSVTQSAIQMTSNGGPDFSNTLGTLADPPVAPPVQPPVVLPVSP